MPKNEVGDVTVVQKLEKNVDGTNYHATEVQKWRGYRQDYSIVAGYERDREKSTSNIPGLGSPWDAEDSLESVKGQTTAADKLPTTGTYNYSGHAFTQNERNGKLSYDVNFETRTGKGEITGINQSGKITLDEGSISHRHVPHTNEDLDKSTISGMSISSTAKSEKMGSGNYTLGFFGPNAEEIAGVVKQNNDGVVGFGGKRGNKPKQ